MIAIIIRLLFVVKWVAIITTINICMSQHITKNGCIEKSTPSFEKGSISTYTESINIHEYVTNILTLYKNLQFPLFTSHGNNVICTTIFDCDLFGSPFLFETLGTNLTAYKLILDMKIISSEDQGFCIMENRIWLLPYCQEFLKNFTSKFQLKYDSSLFSSHSAGFSPNKLLINQNWNYISVVYDQGQLKLATMGHKACCSDKFLSYFRRNVYVNM